MKQLFFLIFFLLVSIVTCLFQAQMIKENTPIGETLFLTPYLRNGDYRKAQELSKVEPDIGNMTSYSGFFTVNEKCESHLFFWFFPAQKLNWKVLPLLLWLQGGPGSSSLYGLFEEFGPFESYKNGLRKRKISWNTENNLLIIDQPVGTGFSFTRNDCYPEDENVVGKDLYSAVIQFHQLFPNFQNNKFFLSGESYAGHYIPALGHTIHKFNPSAKVKINLAAMIIGNGLFDSALQSDYGSYLYQLGLIDDAAKEEFKITQDLYKKEIAQQNWSYAISLRDKIIGSLFVKHVGKDVNIYNYIPEPLPSRQNWEKFIQSAETRNALHVGNLSFQTGDETYTKLEADISRPVTCWVEELLETYPIVFYFGQLDIMCGYPMGLNLLHSLKWSEQSKYCNATRFKWCVGEEQAGYFKGEHHLYDVLVRNAGHMVPTDQPLWAYTLINSVTSGPPDNPLHALTRCD